MTTTHLPGPGTRRASAGDGPATLRLVKLRQSFPRPVLSGIEERVRAEVAAKLVIGPGARIAIAAGSRGIADLTRVLRATVAAVRGLGGEPFLVPAMGSHGGATAEGQRQVLASYGITEASAGCPIRSSLEVVELAPAEPVECRVYMDRLAFESDGVILVNRIKPHTDFRGRVESGLAKMAVIGLGKAAGAEEIHRFGIRGLAELLPRAAAAVFASGKVVLGIAILENAYDETMRIEALAPQQVLAREPALLAEARAHMPRLPVDRLDVLIVDRMGKDISGTGMDTNLIGRMRIRGQPEPVTPDIAMLVVTDLTEDSHGNAAGMGLADVTTRRLLDKLDLRITNTNVAIAGFPERGKLPMVAETDRQALEWALRACGPLPPGGERIARIRDTLHLAELYVSPTVVAELAGRADIEVLGPATECFDEQGGLREF